MTMPESRRAAIDRYDAKTYVYQSIKIRKELIEQFKAIAARRGEKVNTLLKDFIISYIEQHRDEK